MKDKEQGRKTDSGRRAYKLTDKECRNAKGSDRPYKMPDGRGLHLYVSTTGHRSWRLKYRFAGKERRIVFGRYPDIGLAEARHRANDARSLLREGRDPKIEIAARSLKAAALAADTFEIAAREWHETEAKRWRPVHAKDVITSLERDIFPFLGRIPLTQIDAMMVVKVLQKVQARGAIETAHRLRQRISAVFEVALETDRVTSNPAASLKRSLQPKPRKRRWPAVRSIDDARKVVATADNAPATPIVRLASRFLALTAQRPGMIRSMEWSEVESVDWFSDAPAPDALWHIPAAKMKLELDLREDRQFDHLVPLSMEAVEALRVMRSLTGIGKYVFCSARSVHGRMSENALNYLYAREGFRGIHVPHGWRSSFSTIMNEILRGKDDRLIVDLMLAHLPTGVSASELDYNRAAYMPRRRVIANRWASMLLKDAPPAADLLGGRRRRKV